MKSTKKILMGLSILFLIALGAGGAALLVSHSKSSQLHLDKPVNTVTSNSASASQYKLAACVLSATQTIANGSYEVGTDIAPGTYKVISQPAGIGWTNINIYNSKDKWVKQGSPSVEQGNADTSLAPNNNVPNSVKISNGQFMQVDADPAIFTCQ